MYGETRLRCRAEAACQQGLSPRVRGNRNAPMHTKRRATLRQVYPRVYGETHRKITVPRVYGETRDAEEIDIGLSPRVRGNLQVRLRRSDYPRVSPTAKHGMGLSPRVRGNPSDDARHGRVYPRRGNRLWPKPQGCHTVYPRVYGETQACQEGLSPRVRGNLQRCNRRSIPACTGKPSRTRAKSIQQVLGLSPRVRGNRSPHGPVSPGVRGNCRPSTVGVYPRVYGETQIQVYVTWRVRPNRA